MEMLYLGIWKGALLLSLVVLTNSVEGFKKMVNFVGINDGKLHNYIIKQAGLASLARMVDKILLGAIEEDNVASDRNDPFINRIRKTFIL